MYFLIGIWGGKRRVYAASNCSCTQWPVHCSCLSPFCIWAFQCKPSQRTALIAGRDTFAVRKISCSGVCDLHGHQSADFPFHSWLPDAHTRSANSRFNLSAGVLLKMARTGSSLQLPLFPGCVSLLRAGRCDIAIIGIICAAISRKLT